MMKSFFKKLAFVMALAMVVSLAAPAATTATAAENLQIAYQNGSAITELNIAKVDGTEDLRFLNAKTWKNVEWTSSNEAVATVDKNGVVTAKADGTADITVTVDGLTATIKVYCVTPSENKATIGYQDGTERSVSKFTMKVDDTFDFRFFGIKDYDAKRYDCTWLSLTPDVADVDKSGVVTAKTPGTAAITLSVTNKVIGKTYVVAPVVITVEAAATPTPAANAELIIDQKTEMSFELTFKDMNVDVEKLEKNEIEVYNVQMDEETGVEHLYIWQIADVDVVEDKEDTVLVTGYYTNELIDEYEYVVKYVVPNADEELVEEIKSTTFTASVGEVVKVETSYWTYYNNQDKWNWEGVAYTTCGEGEDIATKIFYTLYDDEGVDVTNHYKRANYGKDLVTIELVTEDAEDIFDLDEDTNILTFEDVWEDPYVEFNVVYDDYVDEPVYDNIKMLVKEAPVYKITNIDDWKINITELAKVANNKDYFKQWVALYDDYDVIDMDPLENHEIILWVTDNYGNKYITDGDFADWYNGVYYADINNTEKFVSEGYEIYFESKSPQVLVVGDDEDVTTSNVITTKKTGTATVNVTLENSDEDTIDRIGTLKIQVKAPRYAKTVSTNSKNLGVTTDSIPVITVNTAEDTFNTYTAGDEDFRSGDAFEYDHRFTEAKVVISVKDNHGATFGIYNNSLRDSLNVAVEATNVDTTVFDKDDVARDDTSYPIKYDGVDVLKKLNAAGDDENKRIEFKVTVTDEANEEELDTTYRLSFRNPDHKANGDVDPDSKLDVRVNATNGYVTSGLGIGIQVVETSNGYDVNYADGIELVTDQDRYDELFENRSAETAVGKLYLAVFDPKGKIVPMLDSDNDPETDEFGLVQNESGNYVFRYADTKAVYEQAKAEIFEDDDTEYALYTVTYEDTDTPSGEAKLVTKTLYKDGSKYYVVDYEDNDEEYTESATPEPKMAVSGYSHGTRFATEGSYKIQLIEITKVNSDDEATSNGISTKTTKFKLNDDRLEFSYDDQEFIYVDADILSDFEVLRAYAYNNGADTIDEIAANAFTYWNDTMDKGVSFIDAYDNPVMSEIGGVRFTVNERANAVVLKDVFLKVRINVNQNWTWLDDGPWYYAEVEIPDGKTVSLEDIDYVDSEDSVKYRKDPDERPVQ